MKALSILGSTGSIGTQTLEIVKSNPSEFKIIGLSTNQNIELLEKQIRAFNPEAVAVMDKEKADELREKTDITIYEGLEGLNKIASLEGADTVVNSLVGSIGVVPTATAIKHKKNIALANKETLVTAGSVIMGLVRKHKVDLMPIDSEHSAIFQCLNGENRKEVSRITLTCSGGPFKNHALEQLQRVTKADALKHPTWSMGAKITIDSATLMNKGFEVIETRWLYDVPYEKIDVVMHPQSIIHSLVEFHDTSVIAQLGWPDMKIPIQYALSFPKRFPLNAKPLNLIEAKHLDFRAIDRGLFPCLSYAYLAGKKGGTLAAVMNAANEVAVRAFLQDEIGFLEIPQLIKAQMDTHQNIRNPELEEIMEVDRKARESTQKMIEEKELVAK
ncbi:1-deoxy-D-xylulose-5-phosphate reductoisomerase [Candidatus Woesearchaeota archaeon]|nr:1-deoxy-D-xylulose-5-phosphate reductoisomerase [Candidatus Woesearchaeota archaeon]